jgi:hypothetical protein
MTMQQLKLNLDGDSEREIYQVQAPITIRLKLEATSWSISN